MSLSRTLLRWSIVSALSNYQTQPYPTAAGPLVFDSKIEPIDNVDDSQVLPMIVVYTDYEKDGLSHGTTRQNNRVLTVTFELLVAVVTEKQMDGSYSLSYPQTDAEIEMSLDIMEWQLWRAFQQSNPAAEFFRNSVLAVDTVVSRRGATVESGNKIGARQVTWEIEILKDPAAGVLPQYAADLLNDLEARGEYRHYVQTMRDMYLTSDGGSAGLFAGRHLGYPDSAASALSLEYSPTSVIVPPITWLDQNGRPI